MGRADVLWLIGLSSGKTEAPVVEHARRGPAVPERAPQPPGDERPAAAAVHAGVRAACIRVPCSRASVPTGVHPVPAPLPDVARHVVQLVTVGRIGTDASRSPFPGPTASQSRKKPPLPSPRSATRRPAKRLVGGGRGSLAECRGRTPRRRRDDRRLRRRVTWRPVCRPRRAGVFSRPQSGKQGLPIQGMRPDARQRRRRETAPETAPELFPLLGMMRKQAGENGFQTVRRPEMLRSQHACNPRTIAHGQPQHGLIGEPVEHRVQRAWG